MGLRVRTCVVLLALLVPVLCQAQEFSADVVYDSAKPGTSSTMSASGKLSVSKDRIRLENRGFTDTVLLINEAEHSASLLFPGRKMYEDLGDVPSQYFRVSDAENACPDWQKSFPQKVDCAKVGHESVKGRDTVKYQNKTATGTAPTSVWIDVALKFVVKWQSVDAGAELQNINEGQQSADLFVVPASYKPVKPQKGSPKGFSPRGL